MGKRLAERPLDRCPLAHVDLNGDRASADLVRRSLGGRKIDIRNCRFDAPSGESSSDRAPYALRAAGDEGAFAHEFGIRRNGCRHCPSQA